MIVFILIHWYKTIYLLNKHETSSLELYCYLLFSGRKNEDKMNQIKLLSSVDGDVVNRSFINLELKNPRNTEPWQYWRAVRARPPFILQSLVFLQSLWRTTNCVYWSWIVELIIKNATLTYVYPNIIETCSIPNHLLFGRQLLYSSNATSTDTINCISNDFWNRWRH